jgi:uncharacterized membrane-anchored protein
MNIASAYPNSAISAGAMTLVALVVVGTLAFWLVMVFAADRMRRTENSRAASNPDVVVALPAAAAEDEGSGADQPHGVAA